MRKRRQGEPSKHLQKLLRENVTMARFTLGMEQREFARRIHVSFSSLRKLEDGEYVNPRLTTLEVMAAGIGVPPRFLVWDFEKNKQKQLRTLEKYLNANKAGYIDDT